jgi:hypothetical protein
MKATIEQQREQLMESGYAIIRGMIPPDELQRLRKSVERMIERVPESTPTDRLTTTEWVEAETADAVEFCFDERTLGRSRQLMDVSAVAPLGMFLVSTSGTGWHRDIVSMDMAPLDGLREDQRLNGLPYLQWNVALYDDSFLHFVPGSHRRRNNAEERKIERRMGVVPLPGAITVDLKAGDAIVYNHHCLHSAAPNGELTRRTLIMGYEAFDNRGFAHYLHEPIGVDFVEHLSPQAAEQCRQFDRLHEQRRDQIVATYRAIIQADREAFLRALDTLHPSEHCRMTSLIVLTKIAHKLRQYKDSDSDDWQNTNAIKILGARFTAVELDRLWERLAALDDELRADTEQSETLFQGEPMMMYHFYEMPASFAVEDFIASWDGSAG